MQRSRQKRKENTLRRKTESPATGLDSEKQDYMYFKPIPVKFINGTAGMIFARALELLSLLLPLPIGCLASR